MGHSGWTLDLKNRGGLPSSPEAPAAFHAAAGGAVAEAPASESGELPAVLPRLRGARACGGDGLKVSPAAIAVAALAAATGSRLA